MADSALNEKQRTDFAVGWADFFHTGDESKLGDLFKLFDLDGNGYVDREEFFKVFQIETSRRVPDMDLNSYFDAMDLNKDGKIQLFEFVAFMIEIRKKT